MRSMEFSKNTDRGRDPCESVDSYKGLDPKSAGKQFCIMSSQFGWTDIIPKFIQIILNAKRSTWDDFDSQLLNSCPKNGCAFNKTTFYKIFTPFLLSIMF